MSAVEIGPGIVVPLVLLAVLVPVVLVVGRRRLRSGVARDDVPLPSGIRFTSNALRQVAAPWRVVPEIAPAALGAIDHVLIGPGGLFALTTTMDPLPVDEPGGAARAAAGAIARLELDDVLAAVGASSTATVHVHWGRADRPPWWRSPAPAVIDVDGHHLRDWVDSLPGDVLTTERVDELWRTVTTGIGRPDPLR